MTKYFLRRMMIGFCVFVAATIAAAAAYMSAAKISAERSLKSISVTEQPASAQAEPLTRKDVIVADYYVARCDGNALSVYACSDNGEEFLYTIDVRIEDIPPDDLANLQQGVVLRDRQSLASFEEDFGS